MKYLRSMGALSYWYAGADESGDSTRPGMLMNEPFGDVWQPADLRRPPVRFDVDTVSVKPLAAAKSGFAPGAAFLSGFGGFVVPKPFAAFCMSGVMDRSLSA